MTVHRRREWELPEKAVTSCHLLVHRRKAMTVFGASMLGFGVINEAVADKVTYPPGDLSGTGRFDPGRPITPEQIVTTYNNFYEFGLHKNIWRRAQKLPTEPWTIRIEGEVERPITISFDDLMKKMPVQTRIYRHRCVEAWSIVVPWRGFPMRDLVKFARPLSAAKYIRVTSMSDPKVMPGLSIPYFPWPYREGLWMPEAVNELAFIGTGMYDEAMPKQDGAPIRIVIPWKYGFKSAKSLVKFEFIRHQPETFWEQTSPNFYGFWANVNPKYPTPRWSQAYERALGEGRVIPTQIWNGYGRWVASLYSGMKHDRHLFM